MNDKKAKALRKHARSVSFDIPKRAYVYKRKGQLFPYDPSKHTMAGIQLHVDPASTRGIYRDLKRGIVRGVVEKDGALMTSAKHPS